MNAMATYDGEVVKLYVNGQLEDCKDAKGEIYHPTGSAKVYCIGSDIGSSGSIQSPMIGNVSTAKLYSRTLTDTDAYKDNDMIKQFEHAESVIESQIPGGTASDFISSIL